MAVIIIPFPRLLLFVATTIAMTIAGSALRVVTDRVARVYLDLSTAMKVAFAVFGADAAALCVTLFVAGTIFPEGGSFNSASGYLCILAGSLAAFGMVTGVVGLMIQYPSTREPIGFVKGAIIAAILFVIKLAVVFAVTLLVMVCSS